MTNAPINTTSIFPSELTDRDKTLISETVERRTKLLELLQASNLERIAKLSKAIKEKERVEAYKKNSARSKNKAAKKARKVNRRNK